MTFADRMMWSGAVPGFAPPPADRRVLGLPLPLLAFLVVQAVAWTTMSAVATTSLHPSTVQIVMWGREWYWVNYQHPGLASWATELGSILFGDGAWVPYFICQVFICATYVFVFLLGRLLLDENRALAGALLLAGMGYFASEAMRFSQNVAHMPFWAAFCYALWKASETNRTRWWSFAAAAAALGVYAKLSTLMLVGFGAAWILFDPATRAHLRRPAPWLGLVLFIVMMAPLSADLIRIEFLPLRWISQESSNRGASTSHFLHGQARIIGPMLIFALMAAAVALRRMSPMAGATPAIDLRSAGAIARSSQSNRRLIFLVLFGVGPLVLTMVISLFADLRIAWTSPMYDLAGLLLVALPFRSMAWHARRLAGLAAMTTVGLAGFYGWVQVSNFEHGSDPLSNSWPMAVIGQRFDAVWASHVNAPLRIVGGDPWPAGLVGFDSADQPAMFSNLDIRESPTMTPQRIRRDGMLVVWLKGQTPPIEWIRGHVTGAEFFKWSNRASSTPIEIDYAIIPPENLSLSPESRSIPRAVESPPT